MQVLLMFIKKFTDGEKEDQTCSLPDSAQGLYSDLWEEDEVIAKMSPYLLYSKQTGPCSPGSACCRQIQ
jgi:hypothetical protein